MSFARGRTRKLIRHLEAVYGLVPEMECKGLCQETCGPIMCTQLEAERIEKHLGRTVGSLQGVEGEEGLLTCPLLRDGKCSVYELRPLICRAWGTIQGDDDPHRVQPWTCPHGCRPKRSLTREQFAQLIALTAEIGGPPVLLFDDPDSVNGGGGTILASPSKDLPGREPPK